MSSDMHPGNTVESIIAVATSFDILLEKTIHKNSIEHAALRDAKRISIGEGFVATYGEEGTPGL
jgi:hypothetical protein